MGGAGVSGVNFVALSAIIGFVVVSVVAVALLVAPPPTPQQSSLVQTNEAQLRETLSVGFNLFTVTPPSQLQATVSQLGSLTVESGGVPVRTRNWVTSVPPSYTPSITPTPTVTPSPTFAGAPGVIYCTPGPVGIDPCLDFWVEAMGGAENLLSWESRWTPQVLPSPTPTSSPTQSWFVTLPPRSERTPDPHRADVFEEHGAEAGVRGGWAERTEE